MLLGVAVTLSGDVME